MVTGLIVQYYKKYASLNSYTLLFTKISNNLGRQCVFFFNLSVNIFLFHYSTFEYDRNIDHFFSTIITTV